MGFAATLCSTVAEARAAVDAIPFSLIVLDVLLPDGDGVELLAEVKRRSVGRSRGASIDRGRSA